jgi:hypothetical protein
MPRLQPSPLRALARRVAPLAAVALVGASVLGAAPAQADQIFAPTSVWNAPLAANAPLASNSSTLASALKQQVTTYGAYIDTTKYSTPVYTVPVGQPMVNITVDSKSTVVRSVLSSAPLPAGAKPAVGSDGHLVIWQPSTDSMWEFWRLSQQVDGWHAAYGGKMTGVSTNPGYFPSTMGATATSLPLMGGLMRTSELSSYTINHALAIAVPQALAKTFVWPAQRTDGNTTVTTSIPEGTRFRLPASLDINSLNLKPGVKAMAIAAQKYGMVVRDKSGCVSFYAEDPTPTGSNPYPTIFGTPYMDTTHALAGFPWSKLQVVAPQPTS